MSTDLATELTELLAVDVSALSVGEQTTHMARLERARARFDAESLGRLAEFDQSGAWQIDAAYGAANWLAAHPGTADELTNAVAAWIELMDQDGAEPSDPQHDTVSANQVGDRVKLNGDFGLDAGLPILAALGERTDQMFHRDKKVAEQNPDDSLSMRTPGRGGPRRSLSWSWPVQAPNRTRAIGSRCS